MHDRLDRHIFSPLLAALGLAKRRDTPELRIAVAEMATRTRFGETSEALERSVGLRVPRRTIWDFLQEIDVVHQSPHTTPVPRDTESVAPLK